MRGLPSFDSLAVHRLLRRGAINKAVRGAQLLLVGVVTILVLYLGTTLWNISAGEIGPENKAALDSFESQLEPVRASLKVEPKIDGNIPDYSSIGTHSIFGPLGAQQGKTREQPKTASTLPMTLVGTYVVQGQEPYAIIEEQKRKTEDVFLINDMVFGEAKLVAIFPDHVEISRNGRTEILALDSGQEGPSTGGEAAGGVSSVGENEFAVDEGELDRALENLPLLLTQARAVPYFKDGRSVGLRLFAIKSGSLFERLGLQNGDVLKSVNGNSLADLSQAMQLFQRLKEERSISLAMERNMVEKEFRYQIR